MNENPGEWSWRELRADDRMVDAKKASPWIGVVDHLDETEQALRTGDHLVPAGSAGLGTADRRAGRKMSANPAGRRRQTDESAPVRISIVAVPVTIWSVSKAGRSRSPPPAFPPDFPRSTRRRSIPRSVPL